MTPVLVLIDDYHQAGAIFGDTPATTGPRAEWIERALATHLGAHVAPTDWGADPRRPRALTLAVTGADLGDVADAAEFYLGSAGITHHVRSAAA